MYYGYWMGKLNGSAIFHREKWVNALFRVFSGTKTDKRVDVTTYDLEWPHFFYIVFDENEHANNTFFQSHFPHIQKKNETLNVLSINLIELN